MTEKIQYIPSRLKNAAVGGHIGGTEDIIDDALGKEQSQINQETIQALNDRYTKRQTYNKTELDSMITTPNQEYVTLTAEDGDTLADIFDGVTGAADTIYRVGSWDGTQYDTTKYAEYAFDGTNFVHLSTKTQIGEVFDISLAHASGSELAKYADLAAALGTNGANVPEGIRKGGMSVKYVQSSDNKYVQFRYISTSTVAADFTNAANWQGVDDKPTAGSNNMVKSGGVFDILYKLGDSFQYAINFAAVYTNYEPQYIIPAGTIITSFNGFTGRFIYKAAAGNSFVSVSSSDCPYTLTENAKIVRSDVAGTLTLSLQPPKEYYKTTDVDSVPTKDSNKLVSSGSLFAVLGKQMSLFIPTSGIEFEDTRQAHLLTIKAGTVYFRGFGYIKGISVAQDIEFSFSSQSKALVFDTVNEVFVLRDYNSTTVPSITDIIVMAYDANTTYVPTSPLYPLYLKYIGDTNYTSLLGVVNNVDSIIKQKVYFPLEVLGDYSTNVTSSSSLYYTLTDAPLSAGKYKIKVSNGTGVITSYRLVAIGAGVDLISSTQSEGQIGNFLEYTITDAIAESITSLRLIVEKAFITSNGSISAQLTNIPYDIQVDIAGMKQDIDDLKNNVADILFPVPADIYCAVGTDMNLYYENMFGMLVGKGYMFIDSPNIVYDTSMSGGGNYDNFCNFDRQLHFKPNTAGVMTLYLNVWNEYMKQVAAKTTTLHIVNPSVVSGKTVNMLVNGSSSIDMGSFQSEIKKLLEDNGATVNMVGRWASESDAEGVPYNQKVSNRLSENRSGGASSLFVTKANGTTTKIIHPTSLTNKFYRYDSELVDGAGNHWMVWGNNADFVELVLKSGSISTIPSSGTMTKVTGYGEDTLTYDRLIVDVPQTTNPFWDDSLNGISFASYCQKWNRPTPNVFVTLWGTNDIGGSGGDIQTGKQWATDAQIATFVNRQRILVDAFTRDCPNGVVIMCPQPTGSTATGWKNSDKNGMLYSKLKATQALMNEFADDSNVIIVPVLWWFDRWWSYNIYKRTLSERMNDFYGDTKLDEVSDDTTHPQARGYYQMADAAFSAIVGWVDANES